MDIGAVYSALPVVVVFTALMTVMGWAGMPALFQPTFPNTSDQTVLGSGSGSAGGADNLQYPPWVRFACPLTSALPACCLSACVGLACCPAYACWLLMLLLLPCQVLRCCSSRMPTEPPLSSWQPGGGIHNWQHSCSNAWTRPEAAALRQHPERLGSPLPPHRQLQKQQTTQQKQQQQ
jgi:hypothetical protein